jgi:hypothetical protein
VLSCLALSMLVGGLLTGCAGTSSTTEPTPTPVVACPQVENFELPATCAPYDPDHAMDQNERYRERRPLDEAALAATTAWVERIRSALEPLVDAPSAVAVDDALTGIGIDIRDIQSYDRGGDTLFGVWVGEGCVFGSIDAGVLDVEAGGPINDGGCLPAPGH